ncbi:tetratricopeptide repeat protein [Priestia megaterium]|uniref:tetratricopeptide repeat protein n=1 Tax=Priestia megaterium TaxID=1404 RepID=UPI001C474AAE|nr:NB-ARC domain-containing protein [Priestia megaterium]MBV6738207.1 NACHT domain-containing protein [Priestia megaterium]
MAEIEDQKKFAELLSLGVKELKLHPDYKIKRKKGEDSSLGQSYIANIANELGVSSNTIKSWIGQMGVKYIPGRIDDGKLFGIIWIILKKTNLDILDISWFSKLMETTSIPTLKPALPAWVSSCLEKAKILGADNSFGTPLDKDIEEVVKKIFHSKLQTEDATPKEHSTIHNLPTRWSGVFIGRHFDLEAIRQWVISPSPLCLISGWAGIGKTTIALEVAYACVQEHHKEAESLEMDWPNLNSIIWFSADWKGLTFSDFLNTIAYQLGRIEQINRSIDEKRFVVRNALANYAKEESVLLVIDSIDTAESEIYKFITNLPQGVKVLLTSRENLQQKYRNNFRDMVTIQLKGLEKDDALNYLSYEVQQHMKMSNSSTKQEQMERLLNSPREIREELISATAGNPKAIALSIAYIADDDIPAQQLIQELGKADYSLLELFDFLFGRTWERCNEDTLHLWKVLCFFSKPPDKESWATVAGLDERRFHYAVDQMKLFALIQGERIEGKIHYLGHQTVVTYGEQRLLEDKQFENVARKRWSQYYIHYLDNYLKRDLPDSIYWSYLLGRDLEEIKKEWPNILKVIKWANESDQKELLIELVIRISHFLSRINLPLRIKYGKIAADYAKQLRKHTHEAFFRIDTLGWALVEVNNLDDSLLQIDSGLKTLDQLSSDSSDVYDLKAWGLALKARLLLKKNNPNKAECILEEVREISTTPVIQHRISLVRGDLCMVYKNYGAAIRLYEEANEISLIYGGEKTIEAYFNLGVAYVTCDKLGEAEKCFNSLLYHKDKANQIELIYYHYGMAQLLLRKGEHIEALRSNQKAINLIDSWGPTISIRKEVEEFNEVIKHKI